MKNGSDFFQGNLMESALLYVCGIIEHMALTVCKSAISNPATQIRGVAVKQA